MTDEDKPDTTESDFDDLLRYKLIKDMSKEELIDEIVAEWKKNLEEENITGLKARVISMRLDHVKDRMLKEAGLKGHNTFGGIHVEEDDSNE